MAAAAPAAAAAAVEVRMSCEESAMFLANLAYSSVPNRRVGRNKRAGGKILKKH